MGCLALNASFEPLTILPIRRALRLVIDQKAEILEVDESRTFRSEKRQLACPAVIRLVRFVHVPRKFRRQVTNTFLFARDGYRRDHVVPMSRGGTNTWENVVTACSPCNNRKGSHLPSEVAMHPLHPPLEPNYVELVWAVRRITTVQAKYIRMFYGEEVLRALQPAPEEEAA